MGGSLLKQRSISAFFIKKTPSSALGSGAVSGGSAGGNAPPAPSSVNAVVQVRANAVSAHNPPPPTTKEVVPPSANKVRSKPATEDQVVDPARSHEDGTIVPTPPKATPPAPEAPARMHVDEDEHDEAIKQVKRVATTATRSKRKAAVASVQKRRRMVIDDDDDDDDDASDDEEEEEEESDDDESDDDDVSEELSEEPPPRKRAKSTPPAKASAAPKKQLANFNLKAPSPNSARTPAPANRSSIVGASAPRPTPPSTAEAKEKLAEMACGEERFLARETNLFGKWLLDPKRRKDANGRTVADSDFDARTLYEPDLKRFFQDNKISPGQQQWWTFKSKDFDAVHLFKMGKFYEMFEMDCHTGVRDLGLLYMKGDQPHCGFPEKAYPRYAEQLVRLGHRVVVVEQTETPDMLKARNAMRPKGTKQCMVVNREAVSILTKGTFMGSDLAGKRLRGGGGGASVP